MPAIGSRRRWRPRWTIRLRLTDALRRPVPDRRDGAAGDHVRPGGRDSTSQAAPVSSWSPARCSTGKPPSLPPGIKAVIGHEPERRSPSSSSRTLPRAQRGAAPGLRRPGERDVQAPDRGAGQAAGAVQAKANAGIDQVQHAQLSTLLTRSGLALAIMALASIGLGWVMAGRALRPVRTMSSRARGISERNLHERLALEGPDDELKELADTFDGLLGRLEAAFESQRRFVANASHELRTPITLERALVEVALADPQPAGRVAARHLPARARGQRAAGAADRGAAHAGPQPARARVARAGRPARDHRRGGARGAVGRAQRRDRPGRRVHHGRSGDGRAARGQPDRERRALQPAGRLGQRVDRAARRVADGRGHQRGARWSTAPRSTISSSRSTAAGSAATGTGAGTAAGLGLGLSIVQAIADAHGALLETEARPEGGLRVTVAFPAADGDPASAQR